MTDHADKLAEALDPFETWFASLSRAEQQLRFQHSMYMREAWNAALSVRPQASGNLVLKLREAFALGEKVSLEMISLAEMDALSRPPQPDTVTALHRPMDK